jgi:hypothetical protein
VRQHSDRPDAAFRCYRVITTSACSPRRIQQVPILEFRCTSASSWYLGHKLSNTPQFRGVLRVAGTNHGTRPASHWLPLVQFPTHRLRADLFELRHDIAVVVPRLAPELRTVWEWLQFDTVRRTARALRVSPMTIYQRLKRLRAALLAADLDHSCRKVETPRR